MSKGRKVIRPDSFDQMYRQLNQYHRRLVDEAIERISKNPLIGKELRGRLKGYRSYEVTPSFRLVYKVSSRGKVILVAVDSRKTIYHKLRRMRAT